MQVTIVAFGIRTVRRLLVGITEAGVSSQELCSAMTGNLCTSALQLPIVLFKAATYNISNQMSSMMKYLIALVHVEELTRCQWSPSVTDAVTAP